LAAWVLALGALALPQHYRDDLHSANEASRVYAALAIVHHGSGHLEPMFDTYFPAWRQSGRPPNVDVALKNGRFLPDKAPGLTLLAVPIIATLSALGIEPGYAELVWLLSLLLSALPSVLVMFWLHRRLMRELGAVPAFAIPAILLTSPWLIYGGMFFGHALCASLVALGLPLALGALRPEATRGALARDSFLGGLALGAAVLVEYPAMLLAAGAAAVLALDSTRRPRLTWLLLGAIGPALVLLTWNTLLFGGPLSFPYAYKAHAGMAAAHGVGAFGISWPQPDALHGLILSSRRGLLHGTPWLLAGLVGAIAAGSDRSMAPVWRRALLVLPLCGIAAIAGFGDWHGGRALGPRYLVFIFPLLAIAAASAIARMGRGRLPDGILAVLGGLAGSSLLLGLASAYGFPYVSEQIVNPIFEVVLPSWHVVGPGPTRLDPLVPPPFGALLGAAAALGALLLLGRERCDLLEPSSPGSRPRGDAIEEPGALRPRRLGRTWVVLLALSAAIMHLSLASLPATAGPQGSRLVQKERAFARGFLGGQEAARAPVGILRKIEGHALGTLADESARGL
jgi:hypothetical protein